MAEEDKFLKIMFKNQEYKFRKSIFRMVCLILLLIAVIILGVYGWDKAYHIFYKCNSLSFCENPFINSTYDYCGKYIPSDHYICNNLILPSGYEFGKRPPTIFHIFPYLTITLLIFGFIFNHLLYNRGFRMQSLTNALEDLDNEENKKGDNYDNSYNST